MIRPPVTGHEKEETTEVALRSRVETQPGAPPMGDLRLMIRAALVLAVALILAALAHGGIYTVAGGSGSRPASYVVNRFTGKVVACMTDECGVVWPASAPPAAESTSGARRPDARQPAGDAAAPRAADKILDEVFGALPATPHTQSPSRFAGRHAWQEPSLLLDPVWLGVGLIEALPLAGLIWLAAAAPVAALRRLGRTVRLRLRWIFFGAWAATALAISLWGGDRVVGVIGPFAILAVTLGVAGWLVALVAQRAGARRTERHSG